MNLGTILWLFSAIAHFISNKNKRKMPHAITFTISLNIILLNVNDSVIGDRLLVHPVTHPGVSDVNVYFPGTQDVWYDIDTYRKTEKKGPIKIAVTINKVP
jgi:alpha-glucosidase (family GH31 glycosyl hydrolase)